MAVALAVGDPEHVPAGIYAKEALQKPGRMGCSRTGFGKMFVVRWRWSNAMKAPPLGIVFHGS